MDCRCRAGTPLPTDDGGTAAQTMEHAAALITYDRNVLEVPGLRVRHTLADT